MIKTLLLAATAAAAWGLAVWNTRADDAPPAHPEPAGLFSGEARGYRAIDPSGHKILIVQYSPGGSVSEFEADFATLRMEGTYVVIAGDCVSACTMVITMPHVCALPTARLGFHKAFVVLPNGKHEESPEGTSEVSQFWNDKARQWLAAHGGLTVDVKYAPATAILPTCSFS